MDRKINTTVELVQRNVQEYPDTHFVNFYDEITTYTDLDRNSDAFAVYLQENGIIKGDIVSFMMGNSPYFFYTFLGAHKAGAAGGPISCWWQTEEVEFLINDSKPKVIVIDPEYAPILSTIKDKIPSVRKIIINAKEPMVLDFPHEYLPEIVSSSEKKPDMTDPPKGEDVASIMYTSGTTGRPKGVMLTHKGIMFGAQIKTKHVPVEPGERILCVLPLFHSGGLNDLAIPTMYCGASLILRSNFSATEFWECVEKYKVNGFYIVPTMWNILLRIPEADTADTSSLRMGLSGAAPIPPVQLDECEKRFNIPILEAYGATENSGGITANMEGKRKHSSVGTGFDGIDVSIFDENGQSLPPGEIGEIVVKGATVMKGYLNKPEATAETIKDGWLYTGDVGYMDDEGFLFIVDRIKDMIIRGGVNVYPKELESVIATHPAVDSVAIIPEPHDKYGQVAKACVILKRGETCSAEEILGFCKEKMAPYKVPEHVIFRAALPKNAVGKVVKKDLIKELEEELTAEPVPVGHFFEGMLDRFIPEKAKDVNADVSYHITGKGGGKWTISIRDGEIKLLEEVVQDPRVYMVARDSAYHDIVTGKLDGITAVVTGKMTIEGDTTFMAEFREMFKPL
ncbi:MAG: long-chain-fatty-acid--CoA ligase [Desulfobacterales bacterium]|nr:long-chain-fatty-acid--CoA ligase [Desulfobacterales bacterium]